MAYVDEQKREAYLASRPAYAANYNASPAGRAAQARSRAKIKAADPVAYLRRARDGKLRRAYGLTVEQYDAKLAAQGGRCAICRTDTPGGQGSFPVDHDHETGENRGLLCTQCNTGLGHFRDNPQTLSAAIEYLEAHGG